MAQLDDCVGGLLRHPDGIGEADKTIDVLTTRRRRRSIYLADGGMTPFKGTKGTTYEGGFRVPAVIRWNRLM